MRKLPPPRPCEHCGKNFTPSKPFANREAFCPEPVCQVAKKEEYKKRQIKAKKLYKQKVKSRIDYQIATQKTVKLEADFIAECVAKSFEVIEDKKWPCQDCGKMSDNRMHCPDCKRDRLRIAGRCDGDYVYFTSPGERVEEGRVFTPRQLAKRIKKTGEIITIDQPPAPRDSTTFHS